MNAGRSSLDRFLHAVQRRLILIRLLESCGIFLACGCMFALVLSLLLLWLGRETMTLSTWTLAISALAGALAGIVRRPTLFDAAAEADRQLRLADLLATALSACDVSDSWQQTVVALASERCSTLRPSSVVAHRLGARAWGGIGLSAALVLTVGALSLPAGSRQASAKSIADQQRRADAPIVGETPSSPAPSQSSAQSEQRVAEPSSALRETPIPFAQAHGQANGSTAGEGTSNSTTQQPLAKRDSTPIAAGSSSAGATSAGGGASSRVASVPDPSSQTGLFTTAAGQSTAPQTPWKASTWAQDRASAEQALRDHRVPDTARDVVREYFRPD